jgi:hypothetical protein
MSELNKDGKPPANMHMGSKTVSDTVDIGDMIEKSGCNDIYGVLEECLGEHDRDWRKCQVEVRRFLWFSSSHSCAFTKEENN